MKLSNFREIIHYWNYAPVWQVIMITVCSVASWMLLMIFIRSSRMIRYMNLTLLTITLLITIHYTLLIRTPGSVSSFRIIPFNDLYRGQKQPTIYREMWLNMMMFVPMGISLTLILKTSKSKIIFIGMGTSVLIETIQLVFSMGICEIDDVIVNTLGMIFGVICSTVIVSIRKRLLIKN